MDWRMDDWSPSSRVSPFRHLRIKDYLHLPAAFRSLSRLSSALSAKASTLRSFLLDYSILVIIALITFVTNFWSVTYYSLKNFTVITMSWSNRYLIILSFCMKFSKYISQQILFSSADNGDGEIRTLDPLLARQVLSQLSYAPILMGLSGLEPPTSRLSGVRSNRLSYKPLCKTRNIQYNIFFYSSSSFPIILSFF